ncbi:hypothetical protein QQF64_016891 [Cirrhinus molitorella]|uniref:Uncharacterized protein n=1 Tax=Cirrhinus molitorella TaxID=172907 RepID=A0ABR3LP68_9TELE
MLQVKLRAGSTDHKSVGYHRLESVTLVQAGQRLRPPSKGIRHSAHFISTTLRKRQKKERVKEKLIWPKRFNQIRDMNLQQKDL